MLSCVHHLVAVRVGRTHTNQWNRILTIFLCFLLIATTLSLAASLATPTMTPMTTLTPMPTLQPMDAYVIYISVFVPVTILLCGCIVCGIVRCSCDQQISCRRRMYYLQDMCCSCDQRISCRRRMYYLLVLCCCYDKISCRERMYYLQDMCCSCDQRISCRRRMHNLLATCCCCAAKWYRGSKHNVQAVRG